MEMYSRFDLDKVYEEIKENETKLDQLEKEASLGYSYESVEVYERRNVTIQKWYWQNDILWKYYNEIYQYLYGNSPKNVFSQQYGHDYYGQSNYNKKLEFDRHRMSYDSNLERDEYP